jgi:hypothetical protein
MINDCKAHWRQVLNDGDLARLLGIRIRLRMGLYGKQRDYPEQQDNHPVVNEVAFHKLS